MKRNIAVITLNEACSIVSYARRFNLKGKILEEKGFFKVAFIFKDYLAFYNFLIKVTHKYKSSISESFLNGTSDTYFI